MINKKLIFIAIFCVFACSLIANGFLIFLLIKNADTYQKNSDVYQKNLESYEKYQAEVKVLNFRNMFEEKVLLSNKSIDFDTRLSLETTVRELNDPEIFAQWGKFSNCLTKEEATAEAKNLLLLLIKK